MKFGILNLSSHGGHCIHSVLWSCTLTSFTTTESLCAALTHSNFTLEDNGAACLSVLELHYCISVLLLCMCSITLFSQRKRRLEQGIEAKSVYCDIIL